MSEVKVESLLNHSVNPLEIPEIVENILKYCSNKDFFKCREISHLWNNTAVRLLTKVTKPSSVHEGCCTISGNIHVKRFDLNELSRSTEGKTLENFHHLLSNSKNPEILFKNVQISKRNIKPYSYSPPMDLPLCQSIFKDFGKYVRNLFIIDDRNYTISKKCLGQKAYCPNVEVLKIVSSNNCNSYLLFTASSELGNLKIKHLFFEPPEYRSETLKCLGTLIVLRAILQNSYEIETLHIDTPYLTTHRFIEVLQAFPHVTKNIKELSLDGSIFNHWKAMCEIQFSPSLKTIKLEEVGETMEGFEASKEEKKKGLGDFLKGVSDFLETLDLRIETCQSGVDVRDIPYMARLKKLSIMSWVEPYPESDFLKNLPRLKEIYFDELPDFHQFLENYLEKGNKKMIPGTSDYVPKFVHQHLEKIMVNEDSDEVLEISSPTTIKILNSIFPRFTELEIILKPPHESWVEVHRMWFEQFFSAISQMKNLKVLSLDVGVGKYSDVYYGELDLMQAFEYLKDSPSLEELSIRGFEIADCKSPWMEPLLKALFCAPKLRKINYSPEVKSQNVIKRLDKLKEEFSVKHVTLVVEISDIAAVVVDPAEG